MVNINDFKCRFEGRFFLIERGCAERSWSFCFNSIDDARRECREWLRMRPDCCFASVVVGGVLVAMAGSFPYGDSRVSLAPLAC